MSELLRSMASRLAAAVLLALFVAAVSVGAEDEKDKKDKVDLEKVPKKVMDALKAKFPKAKIHKWSKEKEGDAVFRGAVSVLFHDPSVDAKMLLREKEILEDLENAIDKCDHVAETLTNIAVKNG